MKATKINMKTTSINSKFSAVAAGVNSPWADGADSLGGNSIRSQGRGGESKSSQTFWKWLLAVLYVGATTPMILVV